MQAVTRVCARLRVRVCARNACVTRACARALGCLLKTLWKTCGKPVENPVENLWKACGKTCWEPVGTLCKPPTHRRTSDRDCALVLVTYIHIHETNILHTCIIHETNGYR